MGREENTRAAGGQAVDARTSRGGLKITQRPQRLAPGRGANVTACRKAAGAGRRRRCGRKPRAHGASRFAIARWVARARGPSGSGVRAKLGMPARRGTASAAEGIAGARAPLSGADYPLAAASASPSSPGSARRRHRRQRQLVAPWLGLGLAAAARLGVCAAPAAAESRGQGRVTGLPVRSKSRGWVGGDPPGSGARY